jgi:hypothetical protein
VTDGRTQHDAITQDVNAASILQQVPVNVAPGVGLDPVYAFVSGSSIPADLIRSASVSEPRSVLRTPSTDVGSSIPADLIRSASVSRADSGSLRPASDSDT